MSLASVSNPVTPAPLPLRFHPLGQGLMRKLPAFVA